MELRKLAFFLFIYLFLTTVTFVSQRLIRRRRRRPTKATGETSWSGSQKTGLEIQPKTVALHHCAHPMRTEVELKLDHASSEHKTKQLERRFTVNFAK